MKISPLRVRVLVQKEMRQLLRDPKTKRMTFAAPIIQLLLFGYAVNTDVRNLATVVVDQDQTAVSRLLEERLTASGYFRIVERSDRAVEIQGALDGGRAVVGVQIPPGFTENLEAGRRAQLQVLIDGTSSNTATVAQGYVGRIVQEFAAEHPAQRGLAIAGGIDLRSRAWYNPDLASQDYNVPGIIGLLLMLMALLLTSLGVVRERELGTLEQLMVSPISPRELILGKTIPVVIICLIDLALITTVAVLWFGIPLRGSLVTLVAGSFLYILAGLGFGLLISTISKTQQEAFLTMFLFFLPAIILSGFMYPVDTMPPFFQDFSRLNPIRYFMEMVRNIFLKGHGFSELWLHFTVLTFMAILALLAAGSRFRKSLE
ncbi:MAG: ABC transporter permease [Gemmatimonadetes bacterium]|nr:ABC transporter permease [Gemmatimonadota bacterium]